ncbi:MAG TPA: hypothetical protein VJJ98_03660, partial [Sedimentisphaerales bacterium]|nr:hypothetical protein [Sedimentisphaerales bacterium]
DPNDSVFTAVLVPVTSYDAFLASPNVGRPDGRGVSQITPQGTMPPMPPMVVTKVAGFALVTDAQHADMLVTVATSIAAGRMPVLAGVRAVADDDASAAPVWVYIDAQKAAEAMAPIAEAQMKAAASMPAASELAGSVLGAQAAPGGAAAMPGMPGMMNLDIASMAKNMPFRSVTLGLTPSPNVITIMARLSAIPGTELAQMFVRGSAGMQGLYDSLGAKAPAQMGAELATVQALLPKASQADAVGTYDLMQLGALSDILPIPIEFPAPTSPSKSAIAYAITVDNGSLAVDLAVPKEHVVEIVAYLKQVDMAAASGQGLGDSMTTMQVDTMQADVPDASDDEPGDVVSQITASPFVGGLPRTTPRQVQPREVAMPPVETDSTLFGNAGFGATSTAVEKQVTDEKVRVAGVRLVRYSDLNLGVLPLGRGNGYTLSLIADLPEPAVKIAGGQMDRAVTNNGKSLLSEDAWDRKVRFARLSKDYKTAVFDIELLLPDPGTLGLEELAGALEYFTASGTKNLDLGVIPLITGAAGSQLGAKITSIETDPYENNAPIVALTLNVPGESVESIELYDKNDKRLNITPYGHVAKANAATVKFFVEDELPSEARIVVHIFENLQKHGLPFRITAISLVGLPMQ